MSTNGRAILTRAVHRREFPRLFPFWEGIIRRLRDYGAFVLTEHLMGVDGRTQGQKSNASRVLLVAITIWALAMIIPDLYRLIQPLGSFGFYANNDGLITDVQGPFPDKAASPAFQAGLRPGDRLDLAQMRCIPIHTLKCASALAALGGLRLVSAHRRAELVLAATPERPTRQVEIMAPASPVSRAAFAGLPLR